MADLCWLMPPDRQHVMARKRRHDRRATACGLSGLSARTAFVSDTVDDASDVAAMYPNRVVCPECVLFVEVQHGA